MASLPVEVLFGISFGLLIGTLPAFLVGVTSFVVAFSAGRSVPNLAAVVVAIPVAVGYGYHIGVIDGVASQLPRLVVVPIVVGMLALFASSQGGKLGSNLSREVTQPTYRKRTLAADAIDSIDGLGHVTIRSTGEIRDLEGYPPLSPSLRSKLEDGAWRLPADLPLSELAARLEDQLRTDLELTDCSVSIDGRGRATIAAAPPTRGVARQVPKGWRAVSVTALLPTGLSPGDRIDVETADVSVSGTVLSIDATERGPRGQSEPPTHESSSNRSDRESAASAVRPRGGAAGGYGRVTVAVPTADAGSLLRTDRARVVARSHGTSSEFEAFSLLGSVGQTVRKIELTDERRATLTDDEADVRVLAASRSIDGTDVHRRGWSFEPDDETLAASTEAYVIGSRSALAQFVDDRASSTVEVGG